MARGRSTAPTAVRYRARAGDRRRSARGALRRLVRDVPAQPGPHPGQERDLRRHDRAARRDRRARLRCRLSRADPPDRPGQPQGPRQQHVVAAPGRSRQPLRDRRRRRAAIARSIPISARSTISAALSPPPPGSAWRWRSISRSSAPPTTPGCASTSDWFKFRPDGSIKYAENPPKKYEDIVNVDFYNPDREGLWSELRDTVLFWIDQGVRIFRVDNPHTKPVPFWEWLIREVKARCPEAVFLAEAFTRPKMMRAAGQGRVHPVLYLFHLAQHQGRTDRIPDRADAGTGQGIFPAEFLHQHARHPAGVPAGGRPPGLPHPAGAGRHLVAGLWHL